MTAVVCDGEPDYRELVVLVCSRLGLHTETLEDGGDLLERVADGDCHLVLADTDQVGGVARIAEVRRRSDVPLIALGAGNPEEVLDAGADYHLAKPFSPGLLRATVRAALRRSPPLAGLGRQRIVVGGVVFEPARRRLTSSIGRLALTSREADLLEFLALNAGRSLTRRQIIDGAWGGDAEATDASVVSTVYRLRRKLATAGASASIGTVPGTGYRLVLDDRHFELEGRAAMARRPGAADVPFGDGARRSQSRRLSGHSSSPAR